MGAFAAALIDHLAGNQVKILYLQDKQLQMSATKWTIGEAQWKWE